MKWILIAGIFLMVLASYAGNAATPPPLAVITCKVGCTGSVGNDIFYAKEGSSITLTGASSSGGTNPKQYQWMKDNMLVSDFGYSPDYTFTADEDGQYTLVIKDGEGRISNLATTKISIQRAGTQNGIPDWTKDATISDGIGRQEFSPGDSTDVVVGYDHNSPYTGFDFHWESNNPGVVFEYPRSETTKVFILRNTVIVGNEVIKANLTSGGTWGQSSKKEIKLVLVTNTPPQAKISYTAPLYSDTEFSVDCSASKTAGNYNEGKDFIRRCYIEVIDKMNRIVTTGGSWAKYGETIPPVKLNVKNPGSYSFRATVEDSHGATSTTSEDVTIIDAIDYDKPRIVVPSIVNCVTGKLCKMDAKKTIEQDMANQSISFEWFDVTYPENTVPLKNADGNYCRAPVCEAIFQNEWDYKVKINAKFFGKNEVSTATITVMVRNTAVAQQNATSAPGVTPIPGAEQYSQQPTQPVVTASRELYPGYGTWPVPQEDKYSPSVSAMAALAIIFAAARYSRKPKE